MIRYWGCKPKEVVEHYLREINSDIIVDPFGGSGSIIISAAEYGLKSIYLDINPFAWLIAHVSAAGSRVREYRETVRRVVETAEYIDTNRLLLKRDYLKYRSGVYFWKRRCFSRVSDFFPLENRVKLFKLLKAIDNVECSLDTKLALYLTFAATLFKSSLMNRSRAGSWGVPCYWVPQRNKPEDPFKAFETTADRFEKYFSRRKKYRITYRLEDLEKDDIALLLGNALTFKYSREWSLFTDPPFLDEIQYMELSYFYWVWLRESKLPEIMAKLLGKRVKYFFSSELVVNPVRGFSTEKYLETLELFIKKTKNMREKILIFHAEEEEYLKKTIDIVKKHWVEVRVENITIDNQRNIGPRGSTNYVVLISI